MLKILYMIALCAALFSGIQIGVHTEWYNWKEGMVIAEAQAQEITARLRSANIKLATVQAWLLTHRGTRIDPRNNL